MKLLMKLLRKILMKLHGRTCASSKFGVTHEVTHEVTDEVTDEVTGPHLRVKLANRAELGGGEQRSLLLLATLPLVHLLLVHRLREIHSPR